MLFDFSMLFFVISLLYLIVIINRSFCISRLNYKLSYYYSLLRSASIQMLVVITSFYEVDEDLIISLIILLIFCILIFNIPYKFGAFFRNINCGILFQNFKYTIFLSLPSLFIWLTFHSIRVFDFNQLNIHFDLLKFVQSTTIPILVFTVLESRGPFLLSHSVKISNTLVQDIFISFIIFSLSWLFLLIVTSNNILSILSFMPFFDFKISNLYFILCLLLSIFLSILRSILVFSDSFYLFKTFFPFIFLILIGIFLLIFSNNYFILPFMFVLCIIFAAIIYLRVS
jgi:hypothetical protein